MGGLFFYMMGTIVINKTPRPNEGAASLWQSSPHGHGTGAAQGHQARR